MGTVELMRERLIAGISMHKGYAFVQFASPFDARSGCLGEDGRTICGQVIGKDEGLFFALPV